MASDDVEIGLDATRLAVRALHEYFTKGRDLASAMRDVLGGSGAGPGIREAAALVCHVAVSRRERLSSALREIGAGSPEHEWAPVMFVAAATRWGPSIPIAISASWSARAHLEKIGLEVGLPPVELRRRLDRLELTPFPPAVPLSSGVEEEASTLAGQSSFPEELVASILASHGPALTRNIVSYLNEPAPVYLRVADRGGMDVAIQRLAAEGIRTQPTGRVPGALLVLSGDARRSEALASGLVDIQDEASQLVARLAAPGTGRRVLDYCAGNGGKSLAIASEAGVEVVVHDSDQKRLDALDRRAARGRTRFRRLDPADEERFDMVLLDAPCTGLGAARRAPQVRWRQGAEEIERHGATQRQLLREVMARLGPGGRLVYAVCTFTNTETVDAISTAVDMPDGPVVADIPEWAHPFLVRRGLGYATFPKLWGADIFFVAVLRRGSPSAATA